MSGLLHLAGEADLERVLAMVARCHAELGIESDEAHRRTAVAPLLEGSPLGAVWMIGPKMAPVGYICVGFGWSLEFGGMDGVIDELWIREKVRGRGMGTEVLEALKGALAPAGVLALHLEGVGDAASRLYQRAGFELRPHALMTWRA